MQENQYELPNDNKPIIVSLAEGETITIPVINEELLVSSKTVETGRVLISKKVFEEESVINSMIRSEEVIVEKKEINQYVDVAPEAVRQEGNVTIISVVKEVLVIEKRLLLVEELHITKHKKEEPVVISETVRKEEIHVLRSVSGTEI